MVKKVYFSKFRFEWSLKYCQLSLYYVMQTQKLQKRQISCWVPHEKNYYLPSQLQFLNWKQVCGITIDCRRVFIVYCIVYWCLRNYLPSMTVRWKGFDEFHPIMVIQFDLIIDENTQSKDLWRVTVSKILPSQVGKIRSVK